MLGKYVGIYLLPHVIPPVKPLITFSFPWVTHGMSWFYLEQCWAQTCGEIVNTKAINFINENRGEFTHLFGMFALINISCGKVMFLQVSVCP